MRQSELLVQWNVYCVSWQEHYYPLGAKLLGQQNLRWWEQEAKFFLGVIASGAIPFSTPWFLDL